MLDKRTMARITEEVIGAICGMHDVLDRNIATDEDVISAIDVMFDTDDVDGLESFALVARAEMALHEVWKWLNANEAESVMGILEARRMAAFVEYMASKEQPA